jgi:hypothetical protein
MMMTVASGLETRAMPAGAAPASHPVQCDDARFVIGMNIPDARDRTAGDVRAVVAIAGAGGNHIGYRYTLADGRVYVADRSRLRLTFDGLATMNDLVNAMSPFRYNAFDPRDDGYTVYPVTGRGAAAVRLKVTTAPCIEKTH